MLPAMFAQAASPMPREDPLARATLAKRLAVRLAATDLGMPGATWYLRNVVPRVEPVLSGWSRGRISCLPIAPLVFAETTGARTGQIRTTPLTYFSDGDAVILIGSNFGRRENPGWYHNLLANHEVMLRARGRQGRFAAREVRGAERDRLWALATRWTPPLAKYQELAGDRQIPIMRCLPLGGTAAKETQA